MLRPSVLRVTSGMAVRTANARARSVTPRRIRRRQGRSAAAFTATTGRTALAAGAAERRISGTYKPSGVANQAPTGRSSALTLVLRLSLIAETRVRTQEY